MILTPQAIRARISARIVGRRILCLKSAESTNDVAWAEALKGAEPGLAVFAEEQRRGRGRLGRTWFAPKGSSILCSVLLRPGIEPERVSLVTAAAAIAAAECVEDFAPGEAQIRFPNDVVVGERKIAGVLVEARFISGRPDFFVAGIGINGNVGRSDSPEELRETATSLAIERGSEVSRAHVARALLESLDRWAADPESRVKELRRAWRDRSAILRRRVRVVEGGRSMTGVVEAVDPVDGLELRLAHGQVRHVRAEHIERLESD